MTLRALVIGAGYAGEGHVVSLRDAGVDVVALCGRSPKPTRARAAQLAIPEVRFDWRMALTEFRPDIVAVTTPADIHRAVVEHAAALGCHITCEKPLALTAADARAMLAAVEQAGVRHAYAATACYSPAVLHAQMLVAQGAIGSVREIESALRFDFPVIPYGWVHDRARGGGMLANVFTHRLAQVIRLTGGRPVAATGSTTAWHREVPVGPELHDFRENFALLSDTFLAQVSEWRLPDIDGAYTVTVDFQLSHGHTVPATFIGSAFGTSPTSSSLALYGDDGTLVMNDDPAAELVRHYDRAGDAWTDVTVPEELQQSLPPVQDGVQRSWNLFYRAFVADVQGSQRSDYPTFRDGWMAMEIIDAVRAGQGWTKLPTDQPGIEQPVAPNRRQ